MCIIKKYIIHGNSMLPIYKHGDTVFVSSLPYLFSAPKIDDIVVCLDPRDKRILIKRIKKVKDNKYFIAGDNQLESTDSKSFGMINKSNILAKVILVFRE